MFKLHTKKIYAKYDKIRVFEKSPHEKWKGILSWIIWDFPVIQKKHALTWSGLYRLIFQSIYDTSLMSPGWEIDETVNFRNFCKLLTSKWAAFSNILAPCFQTGKTKRNEVTGDMKPTKHAAMAVSS